MKVSNLKKISADFGQNRGINKNYPYKQNLLNCVNEI